MKFRKSKAGIYILIVNILYILMTLTNDTELLVKLITTIISGFIAVTLNGYMIKMTKKKKDKCNMLYLEYNNFKYITNVSDI